MNLSPKIWGPHAWFFLDSIIMSINNDNIQEYKIFFQQLGKVLPCAGCRLHYKEYLSKYPMTDIQNQDELFLWLHNLHNLVRERNGSKPRKIDSVIAFYNKAYNTSNVASYCFIVAAIIAFLVIFTIRWRK